MVDVNPHALMRVLNGQVELVRDRPILRETREGDTPGPVYLTKQEAARRARVGVRTLERAMAEGTLRYAGGGQRKLLVRFRPEWIDEWADNRGL